MILQGEQHPVDGRFWHGHRFAEICERPGFSR